MFSCIIHNHITGVGYGYEIPVKSCLIQSGSNILHDVYRYIKHIQSGLSRFSGHSHCIHNDISIITILITAFTYNGHPVHKHCRICYILRLCVSFAFYNINQYDFTAYSQSCKIECTHTSHMTCSQNYDLCHIHHHILPCYFLLTKKLKLFLFILWNLDA